MSERIEILNGDDRPHAIRTLKTAIRKASGATRQHLLSVLRSLNPDAARSRAFKGASSMAKSTKKAARSKGRKSTRRYNPTEGTYTLRSVASKARASVSAAGRRAASNFQGLDIVGILKDGAGMAAGAMATSILEKQAEKFLPASLPTIAKSALAAAVVAGGAIAFGGSRGVTRNIAVGAVSEAIRSIGRNLAPGIFAGTDDTQPVGYWDANGQWQDASALAGVVYDPAYPIPTGDDRPVGV